MLSSYSIHLKKIGSFELFVFIAGIQREAYVGVIQHIRGVWVHLRDMVAGHVTLPVTPQSFCLDVNQHLAVNTWCAFQHFFYCSSVSFSYLLLSDRILVLLNLHEMWIENMASN